MRGTLTAELGRQVSTSLVPAVERATLAHGQPPSIVDVHHRGDNPMKQRGLTAGGGMILGMIFGLATGHLVLGMVFGLIFGAAAAARRRSRPESN